MTGELVWVGAGIVVAGIVVVSIVGALVLFIVVLHLTGVVGPATH